MSLTGGGLFRPSGKSRRSSGAVRDRNRGVMRFSVKNKRFVKIEDLLVLMCYIRAFHVKSKKHG